MFCKWTLVAQDQVLFYTDAKRVLYETTQANVQTLCSQTLLDDSNIHFRSDKEIAVENACDEFE